MSPSGNYFKAYKQASHTVGKTRQVVMLYDGIVRLLQQAAEAMEKRDIETRYNKLTRAGEVLMGLQACLDFDAGGKTAQILYDFYSSVDARLLALHRSNDRALCLTLIEDVKRMRDAWDKIDRESNAAAPDAAKPAAPMADAVTFSA